MKICPNCNTNFDDDIAFCTNCGTKLIPTFGAPGSGIKRTGTGEANYQASIAEPEYVQQPVKAKDKTIAGLLAIFLGAFGAHKFYLGYTTPAVIMLLISLLTCGFGAFAIQIISIIEGIMYLSKSDEEFEETYVMNQKQWF